MIGFFEHQYLKYKKNHLHNLIALAKADGHLHDDEERLIYKIGEKYGLKDRQVASLLVSTKKREVHIPTTHEDKMNQLYDLLLMVHADGIVDEKEVHFCENIADMFGFKKSIIKWMLDFFADEENTIVADWNEVLEKSNDFKK